MLRPGSSAHSAHRLDQINPDRLNTNIIEIPVAPRPERRVEVPFNEAKVADGTVRDRYSRVSALFGYDVLQPSASLTKILSESPLGDRITISPVPLVLDSSEYELIRLGTAQVIRAFSAFFEDMVLGDQRALGEHGFIDSRLIAELFSQSRFIGLDGLRELWRGKSAADITFLLGPDLLRQPDGSWIITELNVGPVGGCGDSPFVPPRFLEALGLDISAQQWAQHGIVPPSNDFTAMLRMFQKQQGQELLLVTNGADQYPCDQIYPDLDLESSRIHRMLLEHGIKIVTTQAEVLELAKSNRQVAFIDSGHGGRRTDEMFRAGVKLINAPGTDILLGNKLLLEHLDQLIRFYLHESAVLPVAQSRNVTLWESETFPFVKFKPAFVDNAEPYSDITDIVGLAVKAPWADGGSNVWLIDEENCYTGSWVLQYYSQLPKLHFYRIPPPIFTIQNLIESSRLEDQRIDIRPISMALGDGGSFVSATPWGRATSASQRELSVPEEIGFKRVHRTDKQTNVSVGASELAIFLTKS